MENRKMIRLSFGVRAGLILNHRRRLRGTLASLIVFLGAVATDAQCRADLVLLAPNLIVAPGSSGSFDVLVTSTGGTFAVASDIVELSLTGLSGVSFTGVSIATVTPYIYGANSATTQGSAFTFSSFPGTTFETFDFLFPSGAQTIAPGDTFGLVNVQYSVAANAILGASGALTFGPDTSLADATGNNVLFTPQSGSITIAGATIPEPSSVLMLAIGLAGVCCFRKKTVAPGR
jgi:hypothetical protein